MGKQIQDSKTRARGETTLRHEIRHRNSPVTFPRRRPARLPCFVVYAPGPHSLSLSSLCILKGLISEHSAKNKSSDTSVLLRKWCSLCAQPRHIPPTEFTSSLDYSEYLAERDCSHTAAMLGCSSRIKATTDLCMFVLHRRTGFLFFFFFKSETG